MIDIRHLQKKYQTEAGEIEALRDVTLSVQEGEFISIVGPSGCGKSTLLNIIAGLEAPGAGEVLIDGEVLSGPSRAIGYMPQRDELFPWRSIRGNVMLSLRLRHEKSEAPYRRAEELLRRYGLGDFAEKTPQQLSGGMRQRVALIRTLAADPKILLLDEPFSALDYQTRLTVSDDIARIIREEGKTAILVTHDISESISLADTVYVLSARPGTVRTKRELMDLRHLSPMERREHPAFSAAFHDIWKELEQSV